MKKYLRLQCNLCHRDIDKLVDITHYSPDRCTITQGCEGRLQPLEYRSSAGIAVSPEVGVTDWQPRGSKKLPGTNLTPLLLINLATGSLKQIVIASMVDAPSIIITFEGKADTPKAYRAYVFRKEGAFITISGVESGLEKKALRFTAFGENPDMVEIYVNGVKKDPDTDYKIADGTSTSAPPNTIVFSQPIDAAGVTQVDVIVSKDESSAEHLLTFVRNSSNESRRGTGAYENVNYVEAMDVNIGWKKLNLYTLDLDSAAATLPLNTILIPKNQTDALILLARKPYTQLDRYTDVIIPLDGMDPQVEYLKYYAQDGVTTLRATVQSLITIFPPLRLVKFRVESPITVATAGVEEQLVIDGKVITGPDA